MVFLGGRGEFVARGPRRDRSWTTRGGDVSLISGDACPRMLAYRGCAQVAAVDLSSRWVSAATGMESSSLSGATLGLGAQQTIVRHMRALVRRIQRPAFFDPLEIESLSLDLMSSMLEALPAARAHAFGARLTPTACRRLQNYVREHLDEPISLASLAAEAGCSPRYFSTLFKQAFGITPHKYVMRSRLMQAAHLLRTTRRDLAEIAYDVGFSSQSHFSTAFTAGFRVRPRDYARFWRSEVAVAALPSPACRDR